MSRISLKSFIASAKNHLQQSLRNKTNINFVIGNESADLDSILSAVIYSYLKFSNVAAEQPNRISIPIANIPASDLPLRPELTAILKYADLEPSDLITLDDLPSTPFPAEKTHWTLVDHNVLQGKLGQLYASRIHGTIDHHEDEGKIPQSASPRIITVSGSCSSLIVNYFRGRSNEQAPESSSAHYEGSGEVSKWNAQLASLALCPILIDTINMTDKTKVTEHDEKAVTSLEAKIRSYRQQNIPEFNREAFYNEISDAKSNLDSLSFEEILRKDYKQWNAGDIVLGTAVSVQPLEYLLAKGDDFTDVLWDFAKSRSLQLFALATASMDDEGNLERELLLIATGADKPKAIAEKFVSNAATELQLEVITTLNIPHPSHIPYMCVWNQRNLAASRKRVAPLLREAMLEEPRSSI